MIGSLTLPSVGLCHWSPSTTPIRLFLTIGRVGKEFSANLFFCLFFFKKKLDVDGIFVCYLFSLACLLKNIVKMGKTCILSASLFFRG